MFYTFWPTNNPKWVPRWAQDGPRFRSRFWINFWPHFDPILEQFFHNFWGQFCDQFSLLRFSVFRQDEWQNGCTGSPLRTHLRPILERLGPPPRCQDPRNSQWNRRCAFPLCEPSSRPPWSDFGPSCPLLTSPTNCSEASKSVKIGPRWPFLAFKEKHEKENLVAHFAQQRGATDTCKNWWFLKIRIN